MASTTDLTLADRYENACAIPSDIHEHLHVFVEMCKKLDAKTVIELGTRGGVSTIAWLYGLAQTDGRLYSIDIDPAPELPYDHWTFIQSDDLDQNIYKRLPVADVVFIDTSHMYAHTLAELNLYKWKVRPGGKIVLHDTELARPEGWTRQQPVYPVKTAVAEFCAEEGWHAKFLPNCYGLGIIDVPE
jgi:cephalosporin hydroxylase